MGCRSSVGSVSSARMARIVIPGMAHHLTPRNTRRERAFFEDDDYRAYLVIAHGVG